MREQLAMMLVFVPVVTDPFLTLIRRSCAGHHPFLAHCDFYYQRQYLSGISTRHILILHLIATTLWGILGWLIGRS